ncbi:MAG: hypothetical protein KKF44_06330 [Nanoarchaeota archaeon]|nr:hypothetical protein [Nanoarchaeota archaeon]
MKETIYPAMLLILIACVAASGFEANVYVVGLNSPLDAKDCGMKCKLYDFKHGQLFYCPEANVDIGCLGKIKPHGCPSGPGNLCNKFAEYLNKCMTDPNRPDKSLQSCKDYANSQLVALATPQQSATCQTYAQYGTSVNLGAYCGDFLPADAFEYADAQQKFNSFCTNFVGQKAIDCKPWMQMTCQVVFDCINNPCPFCSPTNTKEGRFVSSYCTTCTFPDVEAANPELHTKPAGYEFIAGYHDAGTCLSDAEIEYPEAGKRCYPNCLSGQCCSKKGGDCTCSCDTQRPVHIGKWCCLNPTKGTLP